MKFISLLLCLHAVLFAVGPALAQDDTDKTPPSKILAMRVSQWNAYYARKHGGQETEVTERHSLALYADALRGRNNATLRRLPAPACARLTRLRAACCALSDDALALSKLYNGGGTMFIEINTSAVVNDEQFFWSLIRSAATGARPLTRSGRRVVAARLAYLGTLVRAADPVLPRRREQLADAYGSPVPMAQAQQARADHAALRADLVALRGAITRDREGLATSRYVVHALPERLDPFDRL